MQCEPQHNPEVQLPHSTDQPMAIRCCLDPSVLQHSTQLQSVQLNGVTFISNSGDPFAASAMLLSCTARMACLEQLSVSIKDTQWTDDLAAYTALTASSKLQILKLKSDALPRGIWLAVFPAGRTCPQLQVLHAPEWMYSVYGVASSEQDRDAPVSAATAADLARLVSCCPALQECTLCLAEDMPLAPLVQLTTLRRLNIQHVGNIGMGSLPSLMQLESLSLKMTGPVLPRHILALTALRHLTYLNINPFALRPEEREGWDVLYFSFSNKNKDKPDVWLQLLKQCARNRACQSLVTEGLIDHVAKQEEVCFQQQHYIEALQQQSAQQQQRIAGLLEKLEHQQQIAAASVQSGEAAELRERLQALESQVQQLMQALQHRDV